MTPMKVTEAVVFVRLSEGDGAPLKGISTSYNIKILITSSSVHTVV